MPVLSAIGAGFGSDKPPKPIVFPVLKKSGKELGLLTQETLGSLRRAGPEAEARFSAGTPRQEALLGDQEGVIRQLLAKRMAFDPNRFAGDIGKTLFGFIDPNVVSPLSRFDVNADILARRARGINPAAASSTAERLRNARIASGRYYDVARQVYGALPSMYNQAFNAGLSSDELARGYLPELMGQYRQLDLAPLVPAAARSELANMGSANLGNAANAYRSSVYGYKQPRNIWDRLGAVDTSMWNSLKEAVDMAMSVYGGLYGFGGMGGSKTPPSQPPPTTPPPRSGGMLPPPTYPGIQPIPSLPPGGYYPGPVNPYTNPGNPYNPYANPPAYGPGY